MTAISDNSITTRKLRSYLNNCGYTDDLLQENYAYSSSSGKERNVPIAGFAYQSRDARDACIVAVDRDLLTVPSFETVANECRDIGAPVLFICCRKELQWWNLKSTGVMLYDTIPVNEVSKFFKKYKNIFSPESIYRAKNLSRVHLEYQLKFVDKGLMPVLEGEMGNRLSDLIKNILKVLSEKLGRPQEDIKLKRWMFQCAFWLLAAKILQDKKVKNFVQLDLEDVSSVLERVNLHYGAQEGLFFQTKLQKLALEAASKIVKSFSSLNNMTIESLAHVYETTLIDKETRKAWGIHATPSYLADYIVWQLFDWIKDIPQEKRIVLEPTCGHAPFLTSALRLLRELYEGNRLNLHEYLKNHLVGLEQDLFAREIARLSLTLADIPNPNGWNLKECDVYEVDTLSKLAKKSTILLCNPPFEDFTPKEQVLYQKKGIQLHCYNKAAEVLWRTLPLMPIGSVFGVVLPRGFIDKKNLADLRQMILTDFELHQICSLPKKVFQNAKHESVVLFGRKKIDITKSNRIFNNKVLYRDISREGLCDFKEKYVGRDQYILQSKILKNDSFNFNVRELDEVWQYCEKSYMKLGSIVEGGQGLIYKGKQDLPQDAKTFDTKRFPGAVKGYALFDQNIFLHGLPKEFWLNIDPEVIRRPMWGMETGKPQIIMNYAPVEAGPWRLKALIDKEGKPVSGRFLVYRLTNNIWSLNALWGILNSPLANAFIYSHTTDRDIPSGKVKIIPIPICTKASLEKLERLVQNYFNLYLLQDEILRPAVNSNEAKKHMLAIDAEVMRLYNLPPRLEWQVLNLFDGHKRKGVDFDFDRYYPKGFESWIPLHEYLSDEYQRSTPSFVKEWVEKNRSPEVIEALKKAVEAFED